MLPRDLHRALGLRAPPLTSQVVTTEFGVPASTACSLVFRGPRTWIERDQLPFALVGASYTARCNESENEPMKIKTSIKAGPNCGSGGCKGG